MEKGIQGIHKFELRYQNQINQRVEQGKR